MLTTSRHLCWIVAAEGRPVSYPIFSFILGSNAAFPSASISPLVASCLSTSSASIHSTDEDCGPASTSAPLLSSTASTRQPYTAHGSRQPSSTSCDGSYQHQPWQQQHQRWLSTTAATSFRASALSAAKSWRAKVTAAPDVEGVNISIKSKGGKALDRVKVVFIKDVPPRFTAGMLRAVPAGAMRHRLFPEGMADYATPENLAKHADMIAVAAKGSEADVDSKDAQQQQLLDTLAAITRDTLVIPRRHARNDEDRMVGQVTAEDVRQELARRTSIDLHTSHVLINKPIEAFGEYIIPLNLRDVEDKQLELSVRIKPVLRMPHGRLFLPPISSARLRRQQYPCPFHLSPAGCKKGDACNMPHPAKRAAGASPEGTQPTA